MFAQPFLGIVPKNTFLLNPKHQNFLNGDERKFKDYGTGTVIVILLVVLVLGVIGGGLAYSGVDEIMTRSQLKQSGIDARATVTDVSYSSSTSKGRTTYTYYMTYEYFVRAGNADSPTRYSNRQQISSDNYLEYDDGSKITVQYLPDNPSISRFMEDDTDNGLPLAVTGGFLSGVILLILYISMRQRNRNKRLENEGQLILGKITNSKGTRVKGGYQVTVTYSFPSPDGGELSRKESFIRNDLRNVGLPNEGTPVAVIYVHDKLYRIL